MTGVYLLHFEPKYKHAGHYMGYADDIERRVNEHKDGQSGVALLKAAYEAQVRLILARTWDGATREVERKLKGGMFNKRTGSLARLCPICKEKKACQKNQ